SPQTSWISTIPPRGLPSGMARWALSEKPSLAVRVIRSPILASRHTHMPAQRRLRPRPVDDEIVPLGLDQHGLIERCVERARLPAAQRVAQIDLIVLTQAQEQLPCSGQPHAVAAFAEIVAHRGDEAQYAVGLGYVHIAGRSSGALGEPRERVAP